MLLCNCFRLLLFTSPCFTHYICESVTNCDSIDKSLFMVQIKFGTDGWRAIIAKEYTVDNVQRVAQATALWLKKNYPQPQVVIGHDCRFGGSLFAEATAQVMCANGVKTFLAEGFVSTPMVSLGTKYFGAG